MRLWVSFLFSVDVHACASRSDIQLSGGARCDADCLVRLEKPLRARGLDTAPAPAAVHLLVSRTAELGFALLNHLREPLDHFGVRMAEET